MKEYIERAALIDDFEHCGASKEIIKAIVDRINLYPVADVAKVRHGRWEYALYNGVYDVKCSNCGYSPGIKFWDSPYCPNCGALMKEDEHETS